MVSASLLNRIPPLRLQWWNVWPVPGILSVSQAILSETGRRSQIRTEYNGSDKTRTNPFTATEKCCLLSSRVRDDASELASTVSASLSGEAYWGNRQPLEMILVSSFLFSLFSAFQYQELIMVTCISRSVRVHETPDPSFRSMTRRLRTVSSRAGSMR